MTSPRRANNNQTTPTPKRQSYDLNDPMARLKASREILVYRGRLPTAKPAKKVVRFQLPTESPSAPPTSHFSSPPPLSPLSYKPHRQPALYFDVEYSPVHAHSCSSMTPLSAAQRAQRATSIPVPEMRLHSTRLPWTIDVREAAQGAGIRLRDVLDAISSRLQRRVRADDYSALDARSRDEVGRAFYKRIIRAGPHYGPAVRANGLLRLDFLLGCVVFLGLSPTDDPFAWEMRFTAVSLL